jgi:hypothetical protein
MEVFHDHEAAEWALLMADCGLEKEKAFRMHAGCW